MTGIQTLLDRLPAPDLPARLRAVDPRHIAPLVLEIDLTESLVDAPPSDPVGQAMARRRTTLRDVLDGLRRAAGDPRVRALVAKVGPQRHGVARTQEIRDAVLAFRRSGKPAVAWAESFGEFAAGTLPYYLATAFGEIWLLPSGDVGLVGVAVEARFLRDALAKAGIRPEVGKRYEYKNAPDTFTEQGFTEPHREAVARVAASVAEQVVAGVAAARGLDQARVREIVDRSPLLATEAFEAGLVDRIGYRDEVYADVRRKAARDGEEPPQLLYLARYARSRRSQLRQRLAARRRPVVALVRVTGQIRLGRSGRSLLTGTAAGSDTVAAALRAAAADDDVRSIVLRVDSPGGSYVASDVIWREVRRAREAGTPVVVSMGDLAASGGYFVAAPADTIVAQPGTLTGSIGVFGGKPVVAELLARLGVGRDAVTEGRHARMFTTARGYTDSEREVLERWLDHVYDDFTGKVAQGRRLSRGDVHDVARGRVWTGADARDRGLVDVLGGLDTALLLAKERAGVAADAEVTIRAFPHVTPLQRLRPPRSSEDPAAAAVGAGVGAAYAEAWGSVAQLAERLALPVGGPLLLPETWSIG